MAEEKRTVFFNIQEGGNQAALVGFTKVKVKNTAGAVIEANKAAPDSTATPLKSPQIQQCYMVTVEANTGEEAAKLVDLLVSGAVDPISGSVIEGPKLGGSLNGKYAVCVSTNLEEVQVMP